MKIKSCTIFDCKVNNLTMNQTLEVIDERISNALFTQHCVVNVAKIVNMRQDKSLKDSVTSCDLINVDGMGVVWGARLLGYDIPERVAGIDLYSNLLSLAAENNWPVYFLGATEEVVSKVVEVEGNKHPTLKIAGFNHGYFWGDEVSIVNDIRTSGAKLLFVAITSPKKENFINRWKEELGVDFVMGVGGTFDVVAGKVNRAPLWMQNNGLEWFYRVIQEPRRMTKRYFSTNTRFLVILLKEFFLRNK